MVQEMTENGVQLRKYMTYTCGHCSAVVAMNAARTRARSRCIACDSLICETNELCHAQCTPLHALAKDHFEGEDKWTRLVPAIMRGASTKEEAQKMGVQL